MEVVYSLNHSMLEPVSDYSIARRDDLLWHFFPGDIGLRVGDRRIETSSDGCLYFTSCCRSSVFTMS